MQQIYEAKVITLTWGGLAGGIISVVTTNCKKGDGYMSVFYNNLMFIVFRRHWFYWVSRDFFDVYLMFILMKNGVISCNSVKGQSGWKRWYCVVCGILCNSIINFWPRYEPKGQGFESLAARQPQTLMYQGFAVFFLLVFQSSKIINIQGLVFIWCLLQFGCFV